MLEHRRVPLAQRGRVSQRHAHQVTGEACVSAGAPKAQDARNLMRRGISCKTGSLLTRQEWDSVRNLPRGEQTPKKRSKGAGTSHRATNPKTGGRPSQVTAGTNPKTGQASRYVFNPDGVFESCDARLRHVGGQFTVLDGNASEVSSISSTVRCWSPAVRRVVLGNTLAEVSTWTALSWCSRSWYVAVMCLSSASPSSLPFSVQVRLRCSLPCSTG